MLWESTALMMLRAQVRPGSTSYAQQVASHWLDDYRASLPSLMSLEPSPTRDFRDLLASWEAAANPPPDEDEPEEETPELCPVCLVAPLAAVARPCGHEFCGSCLSLCARARQPAALTCPLCRTPVEQQEPTGSAEITPLPDPIPEEELLEQWFPIPEPRRRPRVNELFLTERELDTYLNFTVPVLRIGPPPPPRDDEEDWT